MVYSWILLLLNSAQLESATGEQLESATGEQLDMNLSDGSVDLE